MDRDICPGSTSNSDTKLEQQKHRMHSPHPIELGRDPSGDLQGARDPGPADPTASTARSASYCAEESRQIGNEILQEPSGAATAVIRLVPDFRLSIGVEASEMVLAGRCFIGARAAHAFTAGPTERQARVDFDR